MGTPVCPKCHRSLYVCNCAATTIADGDRKELIQQWIDCGCDDSLFDEESLAVIHDYWDKHKMSSSSDYEYQNNSYFGTKGLGQHGHIVTDPSGNVLYVRGEDGTVLYDKKNNIGHLPPDLNWK